MTGAVLALAIALQSLAPSATTPLICKAIQDWTKAHPDIGAGAVSLVGHNKESLYLQHANFLHSWENGSTRQHWNFLEDDFVEDRIRVVWHGWWSGDEVDYTLTERAASGKLSFEEAVAEGRELFKFGHRSFPGMIGGEIFEDRIYTKGADPVPVGDRLREIPVAGNTAIHAITYSFGLNLSSGQYAAQSGPITVPGCGVIPGDHMTIAIKPPIGTGWGDLGFGIYADHATNDTFILTFTNPSGAAHTLSAQAFTIRFWH